MNALLIGAVLPHFVFAANFQDDVRAAKIAQAQRELEPRPLMYAADKADSAEFLRQLEKQTGNVVIDRRQTKMPPLSLACDKVPFWQALDKFTQLAGCGYTAYADGGIALIDGPRRAAPISYQGIVRTAMKRLAVVHDFDADSTLCNVHLEVAWEPRFQPFYLSVGPVAAEYVPRGVAKELKVKTPGRGQLPVAGRSAVEVELTLPAPPRQSPAITTLEGSFKFIGPSKMLTFRFEKIQTDAALHQEEVSVRLNKVTTGLDRWRVEMQIDNPEGTPVFESFQTWLDNNRVALVNNTGTKPPTWLPEPNETVHFENNRKAIVEYAFTLPKQSKRSLTDWTLVVQTPGRIVELTVPYQFKNVPLP